MLTYAYKRAAGPFLLNATIIEADISVTGWENDVYRKSLGDFSLEEILQCKKQEVVSGLKKLRLCSHSFSFVLSIKLASFMIKQKNPKIYNLISWKY